MDVKFKEANAILNEYSKIKLIKDFDLQQFLRDEYSFDTIGEMMPEHTYWRNGEDFAISLNEIEELLSDLLITMNRWRELNSECDDVTIDMVVDSVMSKVAMFNSVIIHNLFAGKPIKK